MPKGSKAKPRRDERRNTSNVVAETAGQTPAAPAREALDEKPLTPHPPHRNRPLLVTSVVLLVIWLAVLVWLATTA